MVLGDGASYNQFSGWHNLRTKMAPPFCSKITYKLHREFGLSSLQLSWRNFPLTGLEKEGEMRIIFARPRRYMVERSQTCFTGQLLDNFHPHCLSFGQFLISGSVFHRVYHWRRPLRLSALTFTLPFFFLRRRQNILWQDEADDYSVAICAGGLRPNTARIPSRISLMLIREREKNPLANYTSTKKKCR